MKVLSLLAIVSTFSLILLGGVVHNTGSSLACPDWPLCYGQFFPEMQGGILIEHGHRLLASFVGLLTIILMAVSYKKKDILFKLSLISFVMVVVQGVLGGLTVIFKLPTLVSTAHLGLSLVFFCTLVLLHHQTQKKPPVEDYDFTYAKGVFLAINLLYLQILLGALIRHLGAGAVCGLGFDNMLQCFEYPAHTLWPKVPMARLHMAHRWMAVVVGSLSFWVAGKSFVYFKGKMGLKSSYTWTPLLVMSIILIQILIGLWTVAKNISVLPTTLHLAFGTLSLAVFWKYFLQLYSLKERPKNFIWGFYNLIKPRLSAMVVVSSIIGMVLAPGDISALKAFFGVILITMVVAGSSTLNCFLEQSIDKAMPRTQGRALPQGILSSTEALVFGVLLLFVSLTSLVFFVNPLTGFLAFLGAITYLFIYTPMKRKSESAVFVGAISGAMPPLMGVTAVTGEINLIGGLLFLILFIWQIPHFFAISLLYEKDYAAGGIKIYPTQKGALFTNRGILFLSVLLVLITLLPWYFKLTSGTYLGFALLLGMGLLVLAFLGNRKNIGDEALISWARKFFLATLIYLPLLLLGLVIF